MGLSFLGWEVGPSGAGVGPFIVRCGLGLPCCGECRPFLLAVCSFPVFLMVVVASSLLLWGSALTFWSGRLTLRGSCRFCPPEWWVRPSCSQLGLALPSRGVVLLGVGTYFPLVLEEAVLLSVMLPATTTIRKTGKDQTARRKGHLPTPTRKGPRQPQGRAKHTFNKKGVSPPPPPLTFQEVSNV